ncbi:MAG TPA: DUF2268 domain-containing putative Zn-dependent protease [Segetibacter sp.]|jgi:hypothetical protein
MRYGLVFCFLSASMLSLAQKNKPNKEAFQIIDLSQKQIRLFNQHKNEDSITRSVVFSDSLYKPYQALWNGYINGEENYIKWINRQVLPVLATYNTRNQQINGKKLLLQFYEVKKNMEKLTGYSPKGTWYIFYGPAWTDLGGLSDGTMLIDLSHSRNSSNDKIMMSFPHEITHQIYGNVNKNYDTTAMGSIIGEGFAVYMNQKYWRNKYSSAANLGFTEEELAQCEKQKEEIRGFFEENKFSTDKKTIDKFRSRSFHLNDKLPGAIGYYIGYKIIENYVQKFGKNSWKDVFTKSPKEIYLTSGY